MTRRYQARHSQAEFSVEPRRYLCSTRLQSDAYSKSAFQIIYGAVETPTAACERNMVMALAPADVGDDRINISLNVFMHVVPDAIDTNSGKFRVVPPRIRAGDFIHLRVRRHRVVTMYACPRAGQTKNQQTSSLCATEECNWGPIPGAETSHTRELPSLSSNKSPVVSRRFRDQTNPVWGRDKAWTTLKRWEHLITSME